jgi:hypothetical protein
MMDGPSRSSSTSAATTRDRARYAIRFVPRRAGSNWSPKNRRMAARLLADGRVTGAGQATLPADL